ncbi:MAG: VWA domain-containing protein, partial [Anaerolineae bacterium]|nr:VWA domain-containing protein [Anaerolineae bacterium]
GHEFGLVLFAGSAFLQFPLTTDLASAEVFLQAASSDSISRQGTNLEAALQVALDGFRIVNGRKRIIILMSDGEDLEGDPLTLVAELANENITVYALGYGTASGAEIPLAGGGVKTDAVGTVVTTRLDDSELRRIAEQGGGGYWAVAEDGIASLVEQLRVHEPAALSSTASGKPVERFAVFLALALVFLSLEILLSEVRPRAA